MHTKLTGWLALICLVFTILWLVFLIVGLSGAGPLDTFERTLAYVSRLGALYYLTYINAALVTVTAVMLFSLLYQTYKTEQPGWAVLGVAFIPIYGAMNLVVYLSQVSVVPQLLQLQTVPEVQTLVPFLLRQAIQAWPASAAAVVNNLAYAVLGIPSIVFGILMARPAAPVLRAGGILLALNGAACIFGFIGIVAQVSWLSQGSLIGGVLFLLALGPIGWAFLRQPPPVKEIRRKEIEFSVKIR